MYKKIASVVTALTLFSFALVPAAQASALTSTQVQAILSLLSAFGANASVVSNVELALTGQPFFIASSTTYSNSSSGSGSSASSTPAACINISFNLHRGESDSSAGGEISMLQRFLHVWPVSGFFGPLTEQAVEHYQAQHGIISTGTPMTTGYGLVGPHTRGWMQCGHAVPPGWVNKEPPTWPPSHATSSNPNPPQSGPHGNPWWTDAGNVTLTASSTGSSTVSFTMTGLSRGAAYTLTFGDGKSAALQGDASGTSTVAHAYAAPGWYEVELLNADNKTIRTTFAQVQTYEPNGTPPTNATSTPVIESMTPFSGGVGTQVVLTGSNFTPTGNIVHFGAGAVANLPSAQGAHNCVSSASTSSCAEGSSTIRFTIPHSIGPYCPPHSMCPMYLMLVVPNTYAVYVQNSNGTSNKESFTVTGKNVLGE